MQNNPGVATNLFCYLSRTLKKIEA